MRLRVRRRAWRTFRPWQRARIELDLSAGVEPCCPECGGLLEAQPTTRLTAVLPAGAAGTDLDCRGCRRFHARVRHTEDSLRALRFRRFARAVLRA